MPDQPRHLIPEEFAGNEWLVDELFDKYQADKNSVDKKWWPIFEQMAGDDQSDTQTSDTKTSAAAPSLGAAARTSGGGRPAVRRDDAAAKLDHEHREIDEHHDDKHAALLGLATKFRDRVAFR